MTLSFFFFPNTSIQYNATPTDTHRTEKAASRIYIDVYPVADHFSTTGRELPTRVINIFFSFLALRSYYMLCIYICVFTQNILHREEGEKKITSS